MHNLGAMFWILACFIFYFFKLIFFFWIQVSSYHVFKDETWCPLWTKFGIFKFEFSCSFVFLLFCCLLFLLFCFDFYYYFIFSSRFAFPFFTFKKNCWLIFLGLIFRICLLLVDKLNEFFIVCSLVLFFLIHFLI